MPWAQWAAVTTTCRAIATPVQLPLPARRTVTEPSEDELPLTTAPAGAAASRKALNMNASFVANWRGIVPSPRFGPKTSGMSGYAKPEIADLRKVRAQSAT
jgi:hypothetical protein